MIRQIIRGNCLHIFLLHIINIYELRVWLHIINKDIHNIFILTDIKFEIVTNYYRRS